MDTPPRQQSLIAPDHFRSHKINTTKSHDILTRLRNASILCTFFLSVEIIGGVLSQSLAVLSDAAHLFADLTSFIIAIVAARLSQLPPNAQNTFGYQRAEALAALFSMSSLLILSLFLGYEAIVRGIVFWNEYWDRVAVVGGEGVGGGDSSSSIHVDGRVMTLTAFVGVLVNVALAVVLGVENHVHMPGDDHGHDHGHEHGHGHSGHGGSDDHDHDHDDHGHGHDHGHGGHEEDKNNHDHDHDHHDDEITTNHEHDHHDHCEDANSHNHEHEHHHEDITPNHDHDHRHNHDHRNDNDHDNKISTPVPLTNNGEQVPLVHHHSHDAHEEEEEEKEDHQHHHHHGVDEESQLLLSLSPRGNSTSYGGTCALPSSSSSQIQNHHEHKNNNSNNNNKNKKHPSHGLEQRNLNLHAAYMHVLADLAQSVSVLIAGAAIWYNPDWKLVDPVSTLIFCVLVIRSTYKIILASVSVLMNQVPTEMDWVTVYNRISNVEGVSDVHNLHLWSVSHGDRAMSVHARAENIPDGLKAIRQICNDLGIQHSTIQLQPMDIDPCVTCGDED